MFLANRAVIGIKSISVITIAIKDAVNSNPMNIFAIINTVTPIATVNP